jgi:ATP phosphoribosyltransferase
MTMEQTECSEKSKCKIQTPGNYPEESIQHSEHCESLKSRIRNVVYNLKKNMLLHNIMEHTLYEIRNLTLRAKKSLTSDNNTVPCLTVRQVSRYNSFFHIVAIFLSAEMQTTQTTCNP